ncbi:MAG: family 16 glycosylhydrolase [Planctomycetota bacterium]|nr:family 16 glycosylhydrolase [Planctomycetota bacterium]
MSRTQHTGAAFVAAALLGSTFASPALAQTLPGWKMTWSDEFPALSLNTTKWNATNAAYTKNNEAQYYTSQYATVGGGVLTLRSDNVPRGGRQYSSAEVTTAGKFSQKYGRFEARAMLPKTQGIWPAFWMLPASGGWPPEIDIMELLGHEPNKVYMSNHWGVYPNNSHQTTPYTGPDFSAAYHTFAVEWDPGRLLFYVDDVLRATHVNSVPAEPFYIILNTAVGGDWPGYPNGTTVFPQFYRVDYVRAYSRYLNNITLEDQGPTGTVPFYGWGGTFGNAYNVNQNGRNGTARSGKLYGNFTGSPNGSGLWQDVVASPGQRWRASAYWQNWFGDRMQSGNTAYTNIEFRDASNNLLSVVSDTSLTSLSAINNYTQRTIEGVAPPGTAKARIVLFFYQTGMNAGAAFFDDVNMELLGTCRPDFNADGFLDFTDFDTFVDAFDAGTASADYNNDGFLDFTDFDAFVSEFEAGC